MGFRNDRRMQLMDSDQIDLAQSDLASQLQDMQQAQALSLAPSIQGSVEQPMVEQQQPTREQSLKSLIEQQMQSGMNRRQKDIELARMLHAEQLKQPNQVDLTNFFGMANAAGADPKNASYKAPENYNPMVGQAAISKEEGAMTDDQLAYLKAQLEAEKAARTLASKDKTDSRFFAAKDKDIFKEVNQAYAKPRDDLNKLYSQYDTIIGAAKSGSAYEIQNAATGFAKMSGQTGALTDQDILNTIPGDLGYRAARAWANVSSDPSYKIPEAEAKAIAKVADRLKDSAVTRYKNTVDQIDANYKEGPMSYGQYSDKLRKKSMMAVRPERSIDSDKKTKSKKEMQAEYDALIKKAGG